VIALNMVDITCKTSNTLFEVLQTWESYLKAENINITELLKEAESQGKELTNNPAFK
jgi:hypothetical protein